MLHSTGTAAPLISKADCAADPSYTVGAIVQADTGCSVPDYVRYLWAVADQPIGALCLAPNLVAEHC